VLLDAHHQLVARTPGVGAYMPTAFLANMGGAAHCCPVCSLLPESEPACCSMSCAGRAAVLRAWGQGCVCQDGNVGAHAALPRRAVMSRREATSGGRTRRAWAGRRLRRTRRRCRTAPLSWRTCAEARTGPRCRPRRATAAGRHMHVGLPLLTCFFFYHAPHGRIDVTLTTVA
jgi:hypothetical protein